ncbi:Arogenate dehydratase/prephenate dehydratase 1, chloroplastic [Gracilariopsis chorda]|uniref:prephenate dehydratase n=1 Tax=Gracilariopsis chorda TaxID=448386 RepID=A0A2V3IHV8_9FLOR|nr:Arogenate dehydratase/prephenate dehydratase 1, chloroplastic [Gracilariopsis chorda]|eukprot:PXF41651.1 Arogenate dehydratase/prephenate dehydratase 1, chloroplastic [Gracilariopsis chorda]
MTTISVAYQGEPGSYSEEAASQFFTKRSLTTNFYPCNSFKQMFAALHKGLVQRAFVPIENLLAGTIHQNLDLLLRYSNLKIVGELDFRINHCLVASDGVKHSDVKVVRSHFMALNQCTHYLQEYNLTSEVAYDTAGSAKAISEQNSMDSAAIASRRAADMYNLNVLAEGIGNDNDNYTRFLVLSKHDSVYVPSTPSKTSIVFSLENGPGVLHKALSVFAVTDIDLTKIESRHIYSMRDALQHNCEQFKDASVERRWEYVFFVDIKGHAQETSVAKALAHLQEITPFFRVLGSYASEV